MFTYYIYCQFLRHLFVINNNFVIIIAHRLEEKEDRLKWPERNVHPPVFFSQYVSSIMYVSYDIVARCYSQSVHLKTRKKKYCVIWTIDTSLWIASRNADLIGSAMCKRVDINLGAGGRNIHKQASKNLYTAVVPAVFFLSTIGSGIFAILSWTRIFLWPRAGIYSWIRNDNVAATLSRPARSSSASYERKLHNCVYPFFFYFINANVKHIWIAERRATQTGV